MKVIKPGEKSMKSENLELEVGDLPSTAKCTFCGKDARRTDRRKNGIIAILGGMLLGGFSLYVAHWSIALIDCCLPFGIGVYWILKKERFVYHCKHCTTAFYPYEKVESTTRH